MKTARFGSWRSGLSILGTLAAAAVSWTLVGSELTGTFGGFELGPLAVDVALRADGFSSWAVGFTATMALLCAVYIQLSTAHDEDEH